MNRDYFEILTMLAGGNANRMYDLFLMYKGYTKKDYESFKRAVHSVLLYGLIEKVDNHYPLFFGDTRVKLTKKGFDALDFYEIKFYKGTSEAKFIDSEFLGI